MVLAVRLAMRQESGEIVVSDTHRNILVGAIVLAKVDQGGLQESTLRGWLDTTLTRADDRALFGL
jgi:hypothetical protein